MALAIVLTLLPLSVVASLFIAHYSEAFLVRVYYFCSSLWLGVGLTLVMALVVARVILAAAHLLGRTFNPLWFGLAALGFTVLYSTYGIWNALHPRLVHCTVRIRNLPPVWRGKTLVQISDIHLGRILRTGFLKRVVAQVNSQNPAMVMITGDLFDGADGRLEELVAPISKLAATRGIYFVTGNHETYLGVERSFEALRATPVTILNNQVAMVDGLQVVGISYPDRNNALASRKRCGRLERV